MFALSIGDTVVGRGERARCVHLLLLVPDTDIVLHQRVGLAVCYSSLPRSRSRSLFLLPDSAHGVIDDRKRSAETSVRYMPIFSGRLYDNTGGAYNVTRILDDRARLNETAYAEYSPPYLS
jgi:hypothetical protein